MNRLPAKPARLWQSKLAKALSIAGEIAPVLAMVSRTPALARLSVAIKAVDIGAKLYDEFALAQHTNPWDIFLSDGSASDWTVVNRVFHSFVVERARDVHVVAKSPGDHGVSAHRATVDGLRVGWLGREKVVTAMYVWATDADLLKERCREDLWRGYGTSHLVLLPISLGPEEPAKISGRFVQTELITQLTARVRAFLPHGPRSYLIIGLPGTGKTTCIKHIVHELGLRSLRVPLAEVIGENKNAGPGEASSALYLSVTSVVSVLRPRILILDDLDRAPPAMQDVLLDVLDDFRQTVDIVLISANNEAKLDHALKRVGRMDDHITVPPLGLEAIRELLGDEATLAERMASWPISFIQDYLKRARVIGSPAARLEVEELERRVHAQAHVDTQPSPSPAANGKVATTGQQLAELTRMTSEGDA